MAGRFDPVEMNLGQKILQINWMFVILLSGIAAIGFAMLFSAAKGNLEPWASTQMVRYSIGLGVMLVISLIDIRLILRLSYWMYGLTFAALVAVELFGSTFGGATRWLVIGPVRLQPSEIAKFTLVLALAKYYHQRTSEEIAQYRFVVVPLLMIILPVGLVLRQPDLGTALLLGASGVAVVFLAGAPKRLFIYSGLGILGSLPIVWKFLHDYQKERVLTFLDPKRDPLGTGYHQIQAEYALRSGQITGKGFINGSQSQGGYVPETWTDFVFAMLGEEFGMLGGLVLLALYVIVMIYCYAVGLRSSHAFGRYLAVGVTSIFFMYFFINMGMVMGMLPVVGLPLPLVSFGGTAMIAIMAGFGLILNVYIHRDAPIARRGE